MAALDRAFRMELRQYTGCAYDEVSKSVQDEVCDGAKAFVKANKERYNCGGYIYSGDGQELGQFWAKLDVGNAVLQKASSNQGITNGNNSYSLAGATYGVFADKGCCKEQLATLTTDNDGNTEVVEAMASVNSTAGNTHLAVCWNVVSAAALYQDGIGIVVWSTARLFGNV